MSKKSNLVHQLQLMLKSTNKGSTTTKRDYETVIRAIIDDLHHLHCLPGRWAHLSPWAIQKLVSCWKNRHIKPQTIANKLSILRGYFKLADIDCVLPSNKQLKLIRDNKNRASSLTDTIIDKVQHGVTKSVISFEAYFGLTKTESMKLTLDKTSLDKRYIVIYRDVAYNNKDRRVPIYSERQQQAIAQRMALMAAREDWTTLSNIKSIASIYNGELSWLGITGHSSFRQQYAQCRYSHLAQNEGYQHESILLTLQQELGFSSVKPLQGWFHE